MIENIEYKFIEKDDFQLVEYQLIQVSNLYLDNTLRFTESANTKY